MSKHRVTFARETDDRDAWEVFLDGECVGILGRTFRERFSATHGFVQDRDRACRWSYASLERGSIATQGLGKDLNGADARTVQAHVRKLFQIEAATHLAMRVLNYEERDVSAAQRALEDGRVLARELGRTKWASLMGQALELLLT